ncbi:vesicle transport protein SFT2B-like isoform X2 [Antennarius striatus]|uniref:vesicle transport protein SFT2B-like isoform X2 n=1 Tax=Antennarius striatus TaxID=241820 RepID=UPI0035ADDCE4
MDKLKKVLGRGKEEEEPEGPGILERADEATTLSCGTRMKGFAFTFTLGILLSFLGIFMLWIPALGIGVFAAFYTAGNICALISTMFLVGPCRQLKTMCAKERALATILMVAFLALTLCAAFVWANLGLALAFCALQFLSFTWYGLSYVPYARETFLKCCKVCWC